MLSFECVILWEFINALFW